MGGRSFHITSGAFKDTLMDILLVTLESLEEVLEVPLESLEEVLEVPLESLEEVLEVPLESLEEVLEVPRAILVHQDVAEETSLLQGRSHLGRH